jgi:hypothetical protein
MVAGDATARPPPAQGHAEWQESNLMTNQLFRQKEIEMSELICLDKTGDTKVIWDKDNSDEVATAKRTFDDLRKKGFTAFSVKKGGEKDELITEFDKNAEKIILVPRIVGG